MSQTLRDFGEAPFRSFLLEWLAHHHAEFEETMIIEELGICQGRSRIDVAVIGDEVLHGYEIKSDRDTLKRLKSQSLRYSEVFDRVTMLVSPKYAQSTIDIVPQWFGVACLSPQKGGFVLSQERASCDNPQISPLKLVQLLWRDEALDVLCSKDCEHGFKSKNRTEIWARVVGVLSVDELRSEVRSRLRRRPHWRRPSP